MKIKLLLLGAAMLAFSSMATAQTAPYATPQFSATFNGPVTVDVDGNREKTSTDTEYSSSDGDVYQTVIVRTIPKFLEVTQAALDFYVGQVLDGANSLDRKDGAYQGHIASSVVFNKGAGDSAYQWRMCFIIANPHKVFILTELAPVGENDDAAWSTFSSSFVIK